MNTDPTRPRARSDTFLTACKVRPAQQRLYIDAYHRITDSLGARPTPPRARSTPHRIHPDRWARYDTTALASGLKAIAIGFDVMKVRREKLTPGIEVALTFLSRSLGREAHRNGRSLHEHLAAAWKISPPRSPDCPCPRPPPHSVPPTSHTDRITPNSHPPCH